MPVDFRKMVTFEKTLQAEVRKEADFSTSEMHRELQIYFFWVYVKSDQRRISTY